MFAVINTGGKQYKVAPNDVILVEKLPGEAGESIEFTNVLMVSAEGKVSVGAPFLGDKKVVGTVLEQTRGEKVIVFKKKRRHNYRRKNGHRQYLTAVRITDVLGGEVAAPKKAKKAAAESKE